MYRVIIMIGIFCATVAGIASTLEGDFLNAKTSITFAMVQMILLKLEEKN